MKPLAFDFYCGLGGWTEGFLAEGYRVVGFDIERHDYGTGGYPGELVLRDVRSIHGAELVKEYGIPACMVGSSPCQEFSYRAMPWKLAKALGPPYLGMELFQAQFRIQREVCEAAGRYIPMVVENVRGAQKWVGTARWRFGSYYLWGDVPALMPPVLSAVKCGGRGIQQVSIAEATDYFHTDKRLRPAMAATRNEAIKVGHDWFGGYGGGFGWDCSPMRRNNSKSPHRKAASALIAKIPFPLAQHIARCFKPVSECGAQLAKDHGLMPASLNRATSAPLGKR